MKEKEVNTPGRWALLLWHVSHFSPVFARLSWSEFSEVLSKNTDSQAFALAHWAEAPGEQAWVAICLISTLVSLTCEMWEIDLSHSIFVKGLVVAFHRLLLEFWKIN